MSQVTLKVFSTLKQNSPPQKYLEIESLKNSSKLTFLIEFQKPSLTMQLCMPIQISFTKKKVGRCLKIFSDRLDIENKQKVRKIAIAHVAEILFDDFPFCGFKTQRELVEARANLTRGPHSFIMQKENH